MIHCKNPREACNLASKNHQCSEPWVLAWAIIRGLTLPETWAPKRNTFSTCQNIIINHISARGSCND